MVTSRPTTSRVEPATATAHTPESLIPAIESLTDEVGVLRKKTRFTHEDATDLHGKSLFTEWSIRAAARGKAAPADMLEELSQKGFAWRDVARMLGISVPAVQKWRRGAGVTGSNRLKLASLIAAIEMIETKYGVQEIASWFEMPLPGTPVTPIDLYADDRTDLVFEYANGNDLEQILTVYDPQWREHYRSSFEVFENADGELAIRPKDN